MVDHMPKRLCVRCRGLPFEANAVSIVDFFDGQVDEAAIHFLADRPGGTKPHAGECYVDCVDENEFNKFLAYHKKYMGNRFIEVLASDGAHKDKLRHRLISSETAPEVLEYLTAIPVSGVLNLPNGMNITNENVIKVRGLPFNVSEEDIATIFAEYAVTPADILIEVFMSGKKGGKRSGNCWMFLNDKETRDQCCTEKAGEVVGGRYLELFKGTQQDIDELSKYYGAQGIMVGTGEPEGGGKKGKGKKGKDGKDKGKKGKGDFGKKGWQQDSYSSFNSGSAGGKKGNERDDRSRQSSYQIPNVAHDTPEEDDPLVVKLNGIPFRSTKRDVVNFFEPEFMIEAQQVYITMGRDGRPAGSALVKMLSHLDAADAVKCLHKKHMEERYIDVTQGRGRRDGGRERDMRRSPPRGSRGNSRSRGGDNYGWLRLRGLPFESTEHDVAEFLSFGYGVQADKDVIIEKNGNRATGQAYVKLRHASDVRDAVSKFHNAMLGRRYIEVYESSTEEVGRRMGNGR